MHQPDHYLKLPQTDNILSCLIKSICIIYGQSIFEKVQPLLQQFCDNRNNIKLGSFQFLLNTEKYLLLLESHISLTSAMIHKLQFNSDNYRFLNVQIGWLDTFTEEKVVNKSLYFELVATMYNYVMVGVLKSNELLRKRKYLEVKEIVQKVLGVGMRLVELIKKNSFNSKDLSEHNVDCLLKISRGYWYLSYVILMQDSKQKKLYQQRANLYYSALTNFQDLSALVNKSYFQFQKSYVKLTRFYMILCQAQCCIRMIKHYDLHITQKPALFKDSLGYCLRGLKAIPKSDEILESYEWAILQGKRDQLGRTQQHLNYRNQQIYKTHPTPDEMLHQEPSKVKIVIVNPNKPIDNQLQSMLNQFWDSQVDIKSQQLQKYVDDTVQKIKTKFITIENQIKHIISKQKLAQQNKKIKDIQVLSCKQTFFTLEETVKLMTDNHIQLQTKLFQLNQKQSCPKIKRWCSENLTKLQQGQTINKDIYKSLMKKRQRSNKSPIKHIPRLHLLNQSFQFLFSKIQQLQQLKLKPYHQMLLKRWKQNKLDQGKKQIQDKILDIFQRWSKQLSKLSNKISQLTLNGTAYEQQYTNQIKSIKYKQQSGLRFYSKLQEQLRKIKSKTKEEGYNIREQ